MRGDNKKLAYFLFRICPSASSKSEARGSWFYRVVKSEARRNCFFRWNDNLKHPFSSVEFKTRTPLFKNLKDKFREKGRSLFRNILKKRVFRFCFYLKGGKRKSEKWKKSLNQKFKLLIAVFCLCSDRSDIRRTNR